MNQDRLMNVIQSPYLSEKANVLTEKHNQFAFRVAPDATKPEIKMAVEILFNVVVIGVNTCNVKPKIKRAGKRMGKRPGWKKAYVTLDKASDIDFTSVLKDGE